MIEVPEVYLTMQRAAYAGLLSEYVAANYPERNFSANQFGSLAVRVLDSLQNGVITMDPTSAAAVLNNLSEESRVKLEHDLPRIAFKLTNNEAFEHGVSKFIANQRLLRRSLPDAAMLFEQA